MERIIVIGAGGLGQIVADILFSAAEAGAPLCPVGFLDDDPAIQGAIRLGLPVLGRISDLEKVDHDAVALGIGNNNIRASIFHTLQQQGVRFCRTRHPQSIVARDVIMGEGTIIAAGAVVNPGSVLGHNVYLSINCAVNHHNRLADHVHVGPGAHLGGDVTIGEGTLIGVGANVIPGRRIGDWTVVGAGSVVINDLPDRVVAVGVPARIIRETGR